MGEHRELKKATEAYWKGHLTRVELEEAGRRLRAESWKKQQAAGIDWIPCGDFSFYDHVLDTTCMVGNMPPRFQWGGGEAGVDTRFLIARGQRDVADAQTREDEKDCQTSKISTFASEMTKWFDTNYHYIVPEFSSCTTFRLASQQIIDHFKEAMALGVPAKPVLLGPVTYLTLGKVHDAAQPDFNRFSLLDQLIPVYQKVLRELCDAGAEWVQLDEPILALDLTDEQKHLLSRSAHALKQASSPLRLLMTVYFGDLRDNLPLACSLPYDGLHVDAVRARHEVGAVARALPPEKVLSVGVVDGRNVWKTDYSAALNVIREVQAVRGAAPLWIAPSCSLIHAPITLRSEPRLDPEIKNWLAFADEKLTELSELRASAEGDASPIVLERNQAAIRSRRESQRIHNPVVQERVRAIQSEDYRRSSPFSVRQRMQRENLRLPAFPTTTIGSFPQTQAVRTMRAKWKRGELANAEYDRFLKEETRKCVEIQDRIGIDMLVHGEFERNDMVEYFGEQLEGFVFTSNGWVQSYGSRCVKPPIIFGDVSRPQPMTTYWSQYTQSLSTKPVKGMLTGPVTILHWSFVRDDQPRDITAQQIALAIRDEVRDLERVGTTAIQIDEPAFREGLPLRKSGWADYLHWAVNAFRLCSAVARDDTQIHTHMCYSEFNDIIESIAALDADVITIETSRSNMELLDAFVSFKYPAEIGPGVYDIHSPRVPSVDEMINLMAKAVAVLPQENLWINPDCGLKTRQWDEVIASLTNMVETARRLRAAMNADCPLPC